MNTYSLGLLKWASIICLSVTGLFNVSLISEEKIEVDNINHIKNTITEISVLDYETEIIYNEKLPKDTETTKKEGKTGLAYKDSKNNIIKVIEEPENKIVEVGTGDTGKYTGKMTGYGADCAGCSGNLSCKTKAGTSWNLITNGIIYIDEQFGETRILAAALSKFPCGTVIEVNNPNIGTFNAIVLDTGGDMRKAYQNGIIHMDLAFVSENSSGLHNVTSSNVEYNVKRWGW